MGTLDPLACGVFPIAISKATRLFDYSLDKKKRYTAIFDFGYTTDTLDIEGVKTYENSIVPNEKQLLNAASKLLGDILQIPPLYSAKCVNGKRAYDLARAGVEFELKPKLITIYRLDLIEKVSEYQYKFEIECSSGTYIRSIARDLAEICGTYGCMSYLERTATGTFYKNTAIELDVLLTKDKYEDYLISPIVAFPNFEIYNVSKEIKVDLINGKRLPFVVFRKPTFIMCNEELLGIAKIHSDELILETFLYEQKVD